MSTMQAPSKNVQRTPDGRMVSDGRPLKNGNPQGSTSAERARRAYELRVSGLTWRQIAEACGYGSQAAARLAAIRFGALATPPDDATRAAMLANLLAKLDQLFTVVERALATSQDPAEREKWVELGLSMVERQARLTGLEHGATPLAARLSRALQGASGATGATGGKEGK